MTLAIAVRLLDALPDPAASTLARSVIEIWLVQWLPASLAVGVGIGLLDQKVRSAWKRRLGALVLVVFFAVIYLFVELTAFAAMAQAVGYVPLPAKISSDYVSFYAGQASICAIYFGLLAWFYLRQQDAERSNAALGNLQLAGLRVTQAVAQDRLRAIQSHVDPDFLFAALSHVQTEYGRDATQAQAALDEVIIFLRSALPRRHAADRAFADEAALAQSFLRLAALIECRPFVLRVSFADSASEAAAFPPHLCLPLVRVMASLIAPEQSMHLSGRVVESRFQVTLVMPLTNPKQDSLVTMTALATAVSSAKQSLAAIYGSDASLFDYAANQRFHINIEIPYAPSANR